MNPFMLMCMMNPIFFYGYMCGAFDAFEWIENGDDGGGEALPISFEGKPLLKSVSNG